jgi:hypothetical protein
MLNFSSKPQHRHATVPPTPSSPSSPGDTTVHYADPAVLLTPLMAHHIDEHAFGMVQHARV